MRVWRRDEISCIIIIFLNFQSLQATFGYYIKRLNQMLKDMLRAYVLNFSYETWVFWQSLT